MRFVLAIVACLGAAGCVKEPPPPLKITEPDAELMIPPKPLPALGSKQPATIQRLAKVHAETLGVCVPDQARFKDLQQYVRSLTNKS